MSDDLDQALCAGTLLIIETGEYSDKTWNGPVRVLKPLSKSQVADQFREEHRKSWEPKFAGDWYECRPDDFLPWLVAAGYVEHVDDVHSWHVGSYGEFEP
jgi:hypothetical protein